MAKPSQSWGSSRQLRQLIDSGDLCPRAHLFGHLHEQRGYIKPPSFTTVLQYVILRHRYQHDARSEARLKPLTSLEAAGKVRHASAAARHSILMHFFYLTQRIARRLYSTATAVFFTFLLRAAFCVLNTIGSSASTNRKLECDICDVSCLGNVYVSMSNYLYVHVLAA